MNSQSLPISFGENSNNQINQNNINNNSNNILENKSFPNNSINNLNIFLYIQCNNRFSKQSYL